MLSLRKKDLIFSSLEDLGIKEEREKEDYLNGAIQRILEILVDAIFSEREPRDDVEKIVFSNLNVPELRVKASLSRYTLP